MAHQLNCDGRVPCHAEQTTDFAEIFAAIQALEVVNNLMITGQYISHVVMKTTSKFLVTAMTKLVWIWVERKINQGQPLVNGPPVAHLHERASALEQNHIKISFCQVNSEYNELAIMLAQEAARKRV
ncbi:uncharacterized protein RSE6_09691 [Rhynchosporium secalis]|uniref:RNase H type-1 domain-containing protein n=1 Tax=Rhynchosporium secalis TaxID=38038 RepID=A0A1E1MIM5_RHYSE|nr:uncharacterized protein RSE6_09691 [Rhynchosporium secalis]